MIDVLLFKSESESSDYRDILTDAGFNPIFVQVLEFEFVNLDPLHVALSSPENYSCLIFTSSNASEACKLCAKNKNGDIFDGWKEHPIFVVGKKTGASVREIFSFSHDSIVGEDAGSAEALAETVISKYKNMNFRKPCLFPCASIKSETLPNKLKDADVDLVCLTVYGTTKCGKLSGIFKNMTIPKIFVFFSPSGVEFVVQELKNSDIDFSEVDCIAIGPVTGCKIIENGLSYFGACAKPNADSLVELLKQI